MLRSKERSAGLFDRLARLEPTFPGPVPPLVQTIALKHADQSPRAMVDLGMLLLRMGDRDGGLAMLEQAIGSGHPEWAQRARAERVRFLEGDRADSPPHDP